VSDPRNAQLARTVIRHSTRLAAGEAILIDAIEPDIGLIRALVDEAYAVGGLPLVRLKDATIERRHLIAGSEAQMRLSAELDLSLMQRVQAWVGLRGGANLSELAHVPPAHTAMNAKHARETLDYRVDHTRWVVMRSPTPAMAQLAGMSTDAFEDFYYEVCLIDYAQMAESIAPLAERMRRADRVHLKGPGTDLKFSIKGIGAAPCEGRHNLPDGECFTAPVPDSIEGTIAFNAPSLYMGTTFTNITLTFEGGRVVRASGDPQERLEHMLAMDEGASRVGEFSLAFNPRILKPMKDILFDEKMAGSLHMALGQAYTRADNGNASQIHWDLVHIQRPEYGGGEVWFDGECIRKGGMFLPPDLEGLNPERLIAGALAAAG
jgi:aminopeptidase